jgi:hypothetical protein
LAFGLVELARAPDLQEELRAEIYATLGSGRAGSVAYDNMPLLNAFIKVRAQMKYKTRGMSEVWFRKHSECTLQKLSLSE